MNEQQIKAQAEKYAIAHHYPDSAAKGIKDAEGNYFPEVENTIDTFTSGARYGYSEAIKWVDEKKSMLGCLAEDMKFYPIKNL